MSNIRYVCISDMHLGADSSVLTNLGPTGVDPSKPSDVLVALVGCLRTLIAQNSDGARPTLILNGDIFEFALSTDNLAAMAFQRFLELAMPADPGARLFDPKILFVPGNHDHHLWETAREIQYANYLKRVPARQFVEAPWHTTGMFRTADVPSPFADAVVARCPGLSGVSVVTFYPNLGLSAGGKAIAFTHGHFTENIYSMMTTLASAMFPGRAQPGAVQDLEAENFAWIDFFWSTLGRSGPVGSDVDLVYKIIQDPRKFGILAGDTARNLLRQYGGGFGRHFGLLLSLLVRSMAAGRLERAQPGKVLSDDGAGLRRYLEGPLRGQLEQELAKPGLPEEITIVFGHTHKPFEQLMTLDRFTTSHIRVYNSGGWVVDRPKPQAIYGGAVILIDDKLDTVSLRMYNESESAGDYSVSVAAAGPPPGSPSTFFNQVKAAVQPKFPPWSDFAKAASAAVDIHTRKLAASLAAKSA
jgi:Calcineurin-like phosphoesterase